MSRNIATISSSKSLNGITDANGIVENGDPIVVVGVSFSGNLDHTVQDADGAVLFRMFTPFGFTMDVPFLAPNGFGFTDPSAASVGTVLYRRSPGGGNAATNIFHSAVTTGADVSLNPPADATSVIIHAVYWSEVAGAGRSDLQIKNETSNTVIAILSIGADDTASLEVPFLVDGGVDFLAVTNPGVVTVLYSLS